MTKHPKAYNAEDEGQIAAATKAADDEEQDLTKIMETQRGRRWVYRLIHTTCHIDAVSHVVGASDSTAFNEGARSVGVAVKAEAMASPNYHRMLEENDD